MGVFVEPTVSMDYLSEVSFVMNKVIEIKRRSTNSTGTRHRFPHPSPLPLPSIVKNPVQIQSAYHEEHTYDKIKEYRQKVSRVCIINMHKRASCRITSCYNRFLEDRRAFVFV